MTTKQYIITTGAYDDYEIAAVVEGAATPALSTLSKQFNSEFEYPSLKRGEIIISGDEIWKRITTTDAANRKALASGLAGDDKAQLFIDWLVKRHGFKVVSVDEMWVG